MVERSAKDSSRIGAVGAVAVIFKPRGMVRVLVKVLVRNVVVLSADHAAKAAGIAFNPIGVFAVAVAVGQRMVDPARLELLDAFAT